MNILKQTLYVGILAGLGYAAVSCNKPNGEKPEEKQNGTDTTTVITPIDTCLTMPHFNTTYYTASSGTTFNSFNVPNETLLKDDANCLVDTIFYMSNRDLSAFNMDNMDRVLDTIQKRFAVSHKIHGGYSVLNPISIYADTKAELEKLGFVVNAVYVNDRPTANAAVKRKSEQYFAMCDARNFRNKQVCDLKLRTA